ncbi:hypothetical protein DM02DRAFT_647372 [Periconia macrospinosa]|uniref:Uncharacterized protein n=1 Tax=Periconia macrospinosa TaxID=97972 RepID=A0A2V1CZQ8_9PLEO|nr:hypothetical protein DM02DRAFT_647372 [Periconia macrospinosa]
MILSYGDDSSAPVPAIFMFVPGMPVVVTKNSYQGLKLVNGANYKTQDVILDKAFVRMPPGTILLTPLSSKLECVRRLPWQRHDVTRRGLPCTAASACTDYKVQGRTLERVGLELRGQAIPSQCDPYSLLHLRHSH